MRGAHDLDGRSTVQLAGPSPRAWGSQKLTWSRSATPVHPHVRGAHTAYCPSKDPLGGPSPRAWGSRPGRRDGDHRGRSIPTCVGLTFASSTARHQQPVHPHVRGAHRRVHAAIHRLVGPSPRAWGSLYSRYFIRRIRRSIPTCVGLTEASACSPNGMPVHPHVRGAHTRSPGMMQTVTGPSPRAWGSPTLPLHRVHPGRSIPTCVGLTAAQIRRGSVHAGPSPRAWGSRGSPPGGRAGGRSIPTCVGLTVWTWLRAVSSSVHPHVRGAHRPSRSPSTGASGPSPRAWGSHPRGVRPGLRGRSIPTCVGLTRAPRRRPRWGTVHPHVRGAHDPYRGLYPDDDGPSPRAWGS